MIHDTLDRRGFLQAGLVAGVAVGWQPDRAAHVAAGRPPAGIDLEELRQDTDERPADLVGYAVESGWQVVGDETILSRPVQWQQELAEALRQHRVELAAVEAVVDLGRITFASQLPAVRRGVLRRLDAAIDSARALRCRHLLIVPGRAAGDVLLEVARSRVAALLSECSRRAARAGMRIVVVPIDRGGDHPELAIATRQELVEVLSECEFEKARTSWAVVQ